MLRFHFIGQWRPGQVVCRWTDSTYAPTEEVRTAVEHAWAAASSRPGVHLFDGPMCRLEGHRVGDHQLELALSRTSYKQFMGTNMANPELLGQAALANPVGMSCAVVSSDGVLLMGRRNDRVAYYPGRIHPFAGALEPGEPTDVFEEIRRELREELSLIETDVAELLCLGMAEDGLLRQPELIFLAQIALPRARIESSLNQQEHRSVWTVAPEADAAEAALEDISAMTPIGVATLLLWGRWRFGETWFEKRRPRFELPPAQ
jgi:hypothetical protein